MKIPGKREVDNALKQTTREIKSALRQINHQAARLVSRGDYEGAQSLVELGKQVSQFGSETEALHAKWQNLREDRNEAAIVRTPLWKYYRPILRALIALNGEAYVAEVEEAAKPFLSEILSPEEMAMMTGGKLVWKRAIRRARRHMINEGFLESGTALRWKITAEGRQVAQEEPDHS